MATSESTTQNITVRLNRRTLRKAKVFAAMRNTSISGLLAEQIEALVGEDDAYEQAQRRALAFLEQGAVEPEVALDLQSLILLRLKPLDPHAGPQQWLWLTPLGDSGRWRALRRALYSSGTRPAQ